MVEHSADVMLHHLGKANVVGRWGGAEFAIVLVDAGEAVAAEKAVWLGKLLMNQPAHTRRTGSPAGRVDCRPSA